MKMRSTVESERWLGVLVVVVAVAFASRGLLQVEAGIPNPLIWEKLTDDNFDEKIADGAWLIYFHNSMKERMVIRAAMQTVLSDVARKNENHFKLAIVDCKQDEDPCHDFSVRSHPFVGMAFHKKFKRGKAFPTIPTENELQTWIESEVYGLVHRLDENNFDETVKEGEWMVLFSQPWDVCKYCRDIYGMWQRLSIKAEGLKYPSFKTAWITCPRSASEVNADNFEICKRELNFTENAVLYFPIVKYFSNGVGKEYEKLLNADEIIVYLEEAQDPERYAAKYKIEAPSEEAQEEQEEAPEGEAEPEGGEKVNQKEIVEGEEDKEWEWVDLEFPVEVQIEGRDIW
ncbi:hypothetical protein QOT17_002918 [Balamuthia mandrillaris]